MDDNLVGYLLNNLDAGERRQVEAHLRASPAARARVEKLRQALAPLAEDDPDQPPPDLILNTLARVAEHRCRNLPAAPRPSPHQLESPPRRWSRRADVLVAAVLLLIVGGLGAPWLVKQWAAYEREACANNLRAFWLALGAYADRSPDGAFPQVQKEGPQSVAGVFVPVLKDAGTLGSDVSVLCPAQGQRQPLPYTTRQLEELYQTRRDDYNLVARDLSGSYAYSLGYWENNTIRGLHRDDGDYLPILADRSLAAGQGNSPNHGGAGQNVLFIGGQVRWCTQRTVGWKGDDIYVNKQYQVFAGENHDDTVLGHSDSSPFPRE
jgi:hypothetical protein